MLLLVLGIDTYSNSEQSPVLEVQKTEETLERKKKKTPLYCLSNIYLTWLERKGRCIRRKTMITDLHNTIGV